MLQQLWRTNELLMIHDKNVCQLDVWCSRSVSRKGKFSLNHHFMWGAVFIWWMCSDAWMKNCLCTKTQSFRIYINCKVDELKSVQDDGHNILKWFDQSFNIVLFWYIFTKDFIHKIYLQWNQNYKKTPYNMAFVVADNLMGKVLTTFCVLLCNMDPFTSDAFGKSICCIC